MNSLSYSSGALNTLPQFHRKSYVVYVEGDDDVPFWNSIFQAFGITNCIIKPAGGSPEIEKYYQSILKDNSDIFIARDADYREILKAKKNHPRVIWTFGHSIENTLYHPSGIAEVIAIYSRSADDKTDHVENWLNEFSTTFRDLLIYEIANEKYAKGIEILGRTCAKYLQSNDSHTPSSESIISRSRKSQMSVARNNISQVK